jgi:hypothetical protein
MDLTTVSLVARLPHRYSETAQRVVEALRAAATDTQV